MIVKQQRLWFAAIYMMLEDEKISEIVRGHHYGRISILSYRRHDLPKFRVKEKPTSIIDLTKTQEMLWSSMSKTTRNEINRTLREDAYAVQLGDANFDAVYDLYEAFEYARGAAPLSRAFMSHGIPCSISYAGHRIAGVFVNTAPGKLRVQAIFSLRHNADAELRRRISNASRRLIWEIVRWGKEKGYASLDLASINESTPEAAAIAAFKKSFGGQTITEYLHVYRSPLFALLEKGGAVKAGLFRWGRGFMSNS